ncbi:hypothetical protein [Streptomyces sp. NPDC088766]|uniref:hypothetical protein n=1 Tax=Streptomyces sp. NPDC088766 TaxID=3365893 RepID=UPI0037FB7FE3
MDVPPETEDARWGRVTDHVVALTRTLAVAADGERASAPPGTAALRTYARLLELLGNACRAAAERAGTAGADSAERTAEPDEPDEPRLRLQDSLRDHAARGAAHTAVLGALLLQAENLWAEVLPAPGRRTGAGDPRHRRGRRGREHPRAVRR